MNLLYHPIGSKLIYLQYEFSFIPQPYERWYELIYQTFESWVREEYLGDETESRKLWVVYREHTANHRVNNIFNALTIKIVEKIFLSLRSDIRLFDFSLTNDNTDEFVRTIDAALMLWKNFEKKLVIGYKKYDNPHRAWWTLQLNENLLTRYNRARADKLFAPQNPPILLLSLNIKSIAVSNVHVTIMCTLMGAYKFTNELDFRLSDSLSLKKLENDFKVNGPIGVIDDSDFPEWE